MSGSCPAALSLIANPGYTAEGRDAAVSPQLIDVAALRKDLIRVVARVCPTWLAAQRDDLVQAAVMRLMQRFNSRASGGEGDPAFTPSYLYKVAHSVLVDEIRRVRRRRETDLDERTVAQATTAAADPERTAGSVEIGRGIQCCLACLTRDRRLAVTLYLQGHSVPEAARILDWSPKRTENLVYRGLADLRVCLTSKGIEP
jgi:RNA polymerase sigma-70 factor, ECF subfamily